MPPALPPRKPFGDLVLACEMRSVAGSASAVEVRLAEAEIDGRHGYRWTVVSASADYPSVPEGKAFSMDDPDSRTSWIAADRDAFSYQYELSLDGFSQGDLMDKFGPAGHLVVYRRALSQYYRPSPIGLGFCHVPKEPAK